MATPRKQINIRFAVLYVILVSVMGTGIIGRILYINFVQRDEWISKAQRQSQKNIVVPALRGDICATDGRLLASSVPFYDVRFDTQTEALTDEIFEKNIDSMALCLAQLFKDKSSSEYKHKLVSARHKKKRYLLVKRNITYNQLQKVKKFPIFRLGKYKGGMIVEEKNKRVKPFGHLASRTIGYLNTNLDGSYAGKVGLEGAYEKILKGSDGISLGQKFAGNNYMPVGKQVDPVNGLSIVTTIDVDMQEAADDALRRALIKHQAKHGCAILMEVSTGDIKAISNLKRNDEGIYVESYNYAVGAADEPGSTFKLASLIVALEDGYVDVTDSVATGRGVIEYHDAKMRDSHWGGYGTITVGRGFELSSNVLISKIIVDNYTGREQQFINRIYSLGLGHKLGLEIKGEGEPRIPDPSDKSWSGVTLPWMAIGYNTHLTPLQILSLYNAIANDGKMVRPRFVREVTEMGVKVDDLEVEVLNPSVCSKATVKKVQALLKGVVENGTARNIKTKKYGIAGKTGTCQLNYWKKGEEKKYQASFAGYFPADNPKYSCVVVINTPTENGFYGNQVAAPVFKEIADKVHAYSTEFCIPLVAQEDNEATPYSRNGYRDDLERLYNIYGFKYNAPEDITPWVGAKNLGGEIRLSNRREQENTVPDVSGMGIRDAIYLLERNGLKVKVSGVGVVGWQSVPAGDPLPKDRLIAIELK